MNPEITMRIKLFTTEILMKKRMILVVLSGLFMVSTVFDTGNILLDGNAGVLSTLTKLENM